MGRVEGEQLSQGLFAAIPLIQPQQAERPDQQTVLAMFVLQELLVFVALN